MSGQGKPYAHWTPEQDKLLSDMAKRGMSFRQIALKLDVSPGAVSGRCHRLKIRAGTARPGPKPKPKTEKAAPSKPAPRMRVVAGIAMVASKTAPPPTAPSGDAHIISSDRAQCFQPLADTTPVSLLETGGALCKFPVNGLHGSADHFCGQPKADSSSPYCAAHSRIAFNPAPLKRL